MQSILARVVSLTP